MMKLQGASRVTGQTHISSQILSLRVLLALGILLTELMFLNFRAASGLEVVLSSFMVSLALILELRFAVDADAPTPADIAVFIFNWLFLDLSPKIQLIALPNQLVNTSSVGSDKVAITNLACALFIATFTLIYALLRQSARRSTKVGSEGAPMQAAYTGGAVTLTALVCVAVVAVAAPHAYRAIEEAEVISPALLIMNRFLLFLPSAALLLLLQESVVGGKKIMFSRACVLLLLFLLVLVTENTYTEKRNALGPLYLSLILVAFQQFFNSRTRRMLLMVMGMVVIFPAISLFTHNHQQTLDTVAASQVSDRIQEYYLSINYDSWANVYSSIEYTMRHGLQWGHQLLGSILFFVPSALWPHKPLATGIFLGQYLIQNYSMWFTNLSAPLLAEGFLDFGWAGVVGYAAVLALIASGLNRLAQRHHRFLSFPLAVYTSLFLVFMMRGSLMVAMGFASAALLSFLAASRLLSLNLLAEPNGGRQRDPFVVLPHSHRFEPGARK